MPYIALKSKERASHMPAKRPITEPQCPKVTLGEELGAKWTGNRK